MAGPLHELAAAYDKRRRWTLELSHLGLPTAVQGTLDVERLPASELEEISKKTKFPHALCVRTGATLRLLKSPCYPEVGRAMTQELVRAGVHPLDIIIATWNADRDNWTFRTSVDHLFWTHRDQGKIEREQSQAAD